MNTQNQQNMKEETMANPAMEQMETQTQSQNQEEEYVTFTVTASDGTEVEMAVIDEFDFENKHYIVSARIVEDTISDEGQFIYRAKVTEDDFTVEKITNSIDYKRVCRAYMEMDTEE